MNNIKSLCLKNSNKVYYSIIPEKMYFVSNKELFDTIEDTLKSSFDFKYIKVLIYQFNFEQHRNSSKEIEKELKR